MQDTQVWADGRDLGRLAWQPVTWLGGEGLTSMHARGGWDTYCGCQGRNQADISGLPGRKTRTTGGKMHRQRAAAPAQLMAAVLAGGGALAQGLGEQGDGLVMRPYQPAGTSKWAAGQVLQRRTI